MTKGGARKPSGLGEAARASFLITHKIKLQDGPDAYKRVQENNDGCIKVVINPESRTRDGEETGCPRGNADVPAAELSQNLRKVSIAG